jgi:hypothetical protein
MLTSRREELFYVMNEKTPQLSKQLRGLLFRQSWRSIEGSDVDGLLFPSCQHSFDS